MPGNSSKITFAIYSTSPLAIALSKALKNISLIKEKYNQAKNPTLPVTESDLAFAEFIEKTLAFIHQDVLPEFDGGKTPGIFINGIQFTRKITNLRKSIGEPMLRDALKKALPNIIQEAKSDQSSTNLKAKIKAILEREQETIIRKVKVPAISGDLHKFFALFLNIFEQLDDSIFNSPELDNQLLAQEIADSVATLLRKAANFHHLIDLVVPQHPMTYEILEEMIQLMNNISQDIQVLAPFFNPESILGLYQTMVETTDNFIVKRFVPISSKEFFAQHDLVIAPTPENQELCYQFITKDETPEISLQINADQSYSRNRQNALNLLLIPATRRYLAIHGEAHKQHAVAREAIENGEAHIARDELRAAILKGLIDNELQTIQTKFDVCRAEFAKQQHPHQELTGIERLCWLTGSIDSINVQIHKNTVLKENLARKANHYDTKKIIHLLQEAHNAPLLQQGVENDHFYQQLLPAQHTVISAGPHAEQANSFFVKDVLQTAVSTTINDLDTMNIILNTLIDERSGELARLWQEKCRADQEALSVIKNTLATDYSSMPVFDENDASALDTASIELARRAVQLKEMQDQCITLSTVPPTLKVSETNYAPIKEEFLRLIETLQQLTQALNKEQQRLEKIKADKLFKDGLRSAKKDDLTQLLQETRSKLVESRQSYQTLANKQHELEIQQAEIDRIEIRRSLIPAEQTTQRQELEQFTATLIELQEKTLFPVVPIEILVEQLSLLQIIQQILSSNVQNLPLTEISETFGSKFDNPIEKCMLILGTNVTFDELQAFLKTKRKRKEEPAAIATMRERLFGNIENKIAEISNQIRGSDDTHTNAIKFEEFTRKQIQCFQLGEQLTKELDALASQGKELQTTSSQLRDEIIALEELGRSIIQLENDERTLVTLIQLLETIDQVNLDIETLREQKDCASLTEKVLKLQKTLSTLTSQTAEVTNNENFQPSVKAINELLVALTQKTSSLAESKLTEFSKALQSLIDQDKTDLATLTALAATGSDKEAFNALYANVIERLPSRRQFADLLQETTKLLAPQSKLPSLVETLITEETLHAVHAQHEQVINKPKDPTPTPEPEPELEPELELNPRKNIVEIALKLLSNYQQHRESTYWAKDKLFSDGKRRREFVSELSIALQDYEQNGNDKAVINLIRENYANFAGIHFQPVLNQIKISILEPDADENKIEDAEITAILEDLQDKNPEYAEAIVNLYQRIAEMQEYGVTLPEEENVDSPRNIVIHLANSLKNDTNRFLKANKDAPPDGQSYERFKEKFTARLHSADDVMSKHSGKGWLPIIGNLLLAVFLIPQLIQTKIRHGHCSFFFSGTKKQHHIQAIGDSVSAIPTRQN